MNHLNLNLDVTPRVLNRRIDTHMDYSLVRTIKYEKHDLRLRIAVELRSFDYKK